MFHLLSPPESHQGGKSVLVDGLQAAWAFKQVHPELYEVLSTLPVPTHASGGPDTLIRPVIQKPIFEEDMYGSLQVIRWNPDDRAVVGQGQAWQKEFLIKDGSVDAVTAFYEAIRKWADFLRSESSEYWFQLEAGKPLSMSALKIRPAEEQLMIIPHVTAVFDNQRVLHGRSSFTGQRRMCGAYIPYDDYMSRLRTLTRKLEGKEWQ